MRSCRILLSYLVTTVCSPSVVFAADAVATDNSPPESENADPALEAFERAKALYKERKFEDASDAFRQAHQLRPTFRLLYNLGQSEAAAKRLGPALEAFEAYLSQGGDEVPPDRATEVREEILRLRDLVGFVEVKAPPGADIVIDGVVRGQSPLPGAIPIAAGVVHSISAIKDDSSIGTDEVKVTGGQTEAVDFNPPSPAGAVKTVPAQSEGQRSSGFGETGPTETSATTGTKFRVLGWTVAAVSAALLLGGAGTGTAALLLDGDIESGCPEGACDAAFADKLTTRDRLAVSTNILLGVGGAALVGGLLMLTVLKPKRADPRDTLAFRGLILKEGTGAELTWRF